MGSEKEQGPVTAPIASETHGELNLSLDDQNKTGSKNNQSNHLRAALAYARNNFRTFPLKPKSKTPAINDWQSVATTDLKAIENFWSENPEYNVPLITGSSNQLCVLDFDSKNGLSARDALSDFEDEFGKLPKTWTQLTGGDGIQFFFHCPQNLILKNRIGIRPNVDFKAEGGYVVAPPSIHPSGKEYHWEYGLGPHEIPLANIPACLLTLNSGLSEKKGRSRSYWTEMFKQGIPDGQRNQNLAQLAGHLLRNSIGETVTAFFIHSVNKTICRPPLPEDEVQRTVESIARLEDQRRNGGR